METTDPRLMRDAMLKAVHHPAEGVTENITLSRTPHHYLNVLSPRGADQPVWLPRPHKVDVPGLAALLRR